ncbi:hypothetical protein Q8F55_005777 [Vanrija albida]|uniref:Uncharacterized protein n=1 Tax=Vanrija albida TaxID=181172 RepID=A0ABR3Q3L6_9TREE
MLVKPTIAALLLLATSGLAAPAANQAESLETRDSDASAPAHEVSLDKRQSCRGAWGYRCPVICPDPKFSCSSEWADCKWSNGGWTCYRYKQPW